MTFATQIPPHLFRECARTKEEQVWKDDRGYTFAIIWSEEDGEPYATCVLVPQGGTLEDAWTRNFPQPKKG
jgi:hypothetical protein